MAYCSNCGKETIEGADVCLSCGVYLNKNNNNIKIEKKSNNGTGIASMIIGIIGFLSMLSILTRIGNNFFEEFSFVYKIWLSFDYVFFPLLLATVSLILVFSDKKKIKNSFSAAGLWLSITTYCMVSIAVIYIFTH